MGGGRLVPREHFSSGVLDLLRRLVLLPAAAARRCYCYLLNHHMMNNIPKKNTSKPMSPNGKNAP